MKYTFITHLLEVAFVKLSCGNKVFHLKTALILRYNALNERYLSPIVSFWNINKMSHVTENHSGYLISLDLAKSPL